MTAGDDVEKTFAPDVVELFHRLDREAREGGYNLNPDKEFTLRLVEGLVANQKRYGYWQCPCRLAFGEKAKDIDVVCPCYYRDADVVEFGACYCALYVSEEWIAGKVPQRSIPERRPQEFIDRGYSKPSPAEPAGAAPAGGLKLPYPVWRCQVCGYLAARDGPPGVCPVCFAKKDRFERFL
ncbi:MAG: ferredoxin:glutaredoxin reductase [Acidobacteria bacterium]|nr:ferredoxin:glutaredoxin reductase [Acidobacteriota bacterium]